MRVCHFVAMVKFFRRGRLMICVSVVINVSWSFWLLISLHLYLLLSVSQSLSFSPPVTSGRGVLSASGPAASDRKLSPETETKEEKRFESTLQCHKPTAAAVSCVRVYTSCESRFYWRVLAHGDCLWCVVDSSEAVKNFTARDGEEKETEEEEEVKKAECRSCESNEPLMTLSLFILWGICALFLTFGSNLQHQDQKRHLNLLKSKIRKVWFEKKPKM